MHAEINDRVDVFQNGAPEVKKLHEIVEDDIEKELPVKVILIHYILPFLFHFFFKIGVLKFMVFDVIFATSTGRVMGQ